MDKPGYKKKFQVSIKRQADFLLSLAVLIILSPLFLLIAFLVKITSKGPVFFIQERPGKDAKMFSIIKFRTMAAGAEKFGLNMEESNPRITRIGRLLRRTHLDEMPQLVNIIKGQMSFVGPRPPLLSQVDMDSDFEKRRFLMKPGLAGWAQLNGANWISWQERVKYDVWYVDNFSIFLDVKIFILSFWKLVIRGDGVYDTKGKKS